jgi:hypothetical protein
VGLSKDGITNDVEVFVIIERFSEIGKFNFSKYGIL